MIIPIKIKPQIHYRLTAIKRSRSGKVLHSRSSEELPNVFTNYGVEALLGGTTGDNIGAMAAAVGTGSSEPSIVQSALDSFVAGAYNGNDGDYVFRRSFVDNGDGSGYVEIRKDTLFATGAAAGNLSEVGAAFRGTAPNNLTPLVSRALVLDGSGQPTTFEVLSDEELLLSKFFRINISLEDLVFPAVPIIGDGPDQAITIRPFGLGTLDTFWKWPAGFSHTSASRGYWGENYTLPENLQNSGSSSGAGSGSGNFAQGMQAGVDDYVANSKERVAWMRLPTGVARNFVGAQFNVGGQSWAVKLDPGIPKSELHRATVGLKFIIDNTP